MSLLKKKFASLKKVLETKKIYKTFSGDNLIYDKKIVDQFETYKYSVLNLMLCKNFHDYVKKQYDYDLSNKVIDSDDNESEDDNSDDDNEPIDDDGDEFTTTFNEVVILINNFCNDIEIMNIISPITGFNPTDFSHDLVLYYLKYLDLINKN